MLRLAAGGVGKECGEVGVFVQLRMVFVDELWRQADHSVEGDAVEGRHRQPRLGCVDECTVQDYLVPPVAIYLNT